MLISDIIVLVIHYIFSFSILIILTLMEIYRRQKGNYLKLQFTIYYVEYIHANGNLYNFKSKPFTQLGLIHY